MLEVDGHTLTLTIDLTPNLLTRNKSASTYVDAINLGHNPHKLRYLQCTDNLVRTRLIRAWEQVANPRMRMCLDLGERGRFLYLVLPHSLFMGGVQLDVQQVLDNAAVLQSLEHSLEEH